MTLPKYKVGTSERVIGGATNDPEGFIVANLFTLNAFIVSGGVWSSTSIPAILILVWPHLGGDAPIIDPGFTYYVNVNSGNDSNNGTSPTTPWGTTAPADSVSLTSGQTIAYWYNSAWHLYRELGVTANQLDLPSDLITYTADQV